MGGKGEMTTTPIGLQDLRRKIYAKAKAEPHWRFWGLYVHVCKMETLRAAYAMAKANEGAPGSDGVTFEAIEEQGVKGFLARADPGRTDPAHLCAAAGAQEADTEGGQQQNANSFDSLHP
jgi:RNA-directed DNA polymerase